jgi:hypothetical protein
MARAMSVSRGGILIAKERVEKRIQKDKVFTSKLESVKEIFQKPSVDSIGFDPNGMCEN